MSTKTNLLSTFIFDVVYLHNVSDHALMIKQLIISSSVKWNTVQNLHFIGVPVPQCVTQIAVGNSQLVCTHFYSILYKTGNRQSSFFQECPWGIFSVGQNCMWSKLLIGRNPDKFDHHGYLPQLEIFPWPRQGKTWLIVNSQSFLGITKGLAACNYRGTSNISSTKYHINWLSFHLAVVFVPSIEVWVYLWDAQSWNIKSLMIEWQENVYIYIYIICILPSITYMVYIQWLYT